MIKTSIYKSLDEWRKADPELYYFAYDRGKIEEMCEKFGWIIKRKPPGYWTKERCIEDAKKYKTKKEWVESSGSAYFTVRKNDWLDECCMHMIEGKKPNGYWTKKRCVEEAKKHKTVIEWKENSSSSYNAAYINKWSDECCKHMIEVNKPKGYWTKERCIENAKKYKTKIEWKNKSGGAYNKALKNKWIDECSKHMLVNKNIKPKGYWTKERCIKDAKKYKTKKEWAEKSACSMAYKNGWIDECCSHMISVNKPKGYWTKEKCIEDAKKHKTRNKWIENSGSSYNIARKNKWLDECCKHMLETRKPNGYWTKERCIKDAQKYTTKKEWAEKSASAYSKALKNKWIDECCKYKKFYDNKEGYFKLMRKEKIKSNREWENKYKELSKRDKIKYYSALWTLFNQTCKQFFSEYKKWSLKNL